jgi:hypothetical protein
MNIRPAGDPPPMPGVRDALIYRPDVIRAVNRMDQCWNKEQLQDAIRSARLFLDLMDRALQSNLTQRNERKT